MDNSVNLKKFCFHKDDFFKVIFSVDLFLRNNKQSELNIIRNDLGIYLRFLRASLIDLINQDYSDFVSLSGNLKGLDIILRNLSIPLINLRNDISNLKFLLTTNLVRLDNCHTKDTKIHSLRKTLNGLLNVYAYFRELELQNGGKNDWKDYNHLERSFITTIQINYNSTFCPSDMECIKIIDETKYLHNQLCTELNHFFIANFKIPSEKIKNSLRIYILLNICFIAENIFRTRVRSHIDNAFSEYINGNCHISKVYYKILDFIALNMKELLLCTYYNYEIKGFNFLINSFWYEIVERFATIMSSLYVTGDPNLFFNNYKITADFILRIEEMLKTKKEVQIFRQHTKTKLFEKQWNLSVYFQITYLEIATDLEKAFDQDLNKIIKSTETYLSERVSVEYITVAYNCLKNCWSDSSYIINIFPKYLKFTCLILARVIKWTEYLLLNENYGTNRNNLSFLVSVYNNIVFLLKFLQEIILKIIDKNKVILLEKELFEKSFQDFKSNITLILKRVEQNIILNIVSTSSEFISHVADVSRLYRKTNREVPKKHSIYVQSMLDPADFFQKEFGGEMRPEIIHRIIKEYFSKLTCMYYNSTEEALSSVQKTENSLKRLKIVRGKIDNDNTASISDDDKIRLQFELDVRFWATEIEKRKFQNEEITQLYELTKMVQDATKCIKC